MIEELQQDERPSPYNLAIVYRGLGNLERAIDWLEQAFDERSSYLLAYNDHRDSTSQDWLSLGVVEFISTCVPRFPKIDSTFGSQPTGLNQLIPANKASISALVKPASARADRLNGPRIEPVKRLRSSSRKVSTGGLFSCLQQ